MRRLVLSLIVVLVVSGLAAPATSYAQQSVNFYIGGFVPRGEDARTDNDVLVGNLENAGLAFNIGDFTSATVGGEWLFGLGERFDAGLGLGFYSDTVPSSLQGSDTLERSRDQTGSQAAHRAVHRDRPVPPARSRGGHPAVHRRRRRRLRVALQRDRGVRGLQRLQHLPRQLLGSGATAGPVVMGGVGIPIGSFSAGFEIRYQSAQGDLPLDQGFAGTKIDLGGFNYLATFKVGF